MSDLITLLQRIKRAGGCVEIIILWEKRVADKMKEMGVHLILNPNKFSGLHDVFHNILELTGV